MGFLHFFKRLFCLIGHTVFLLYKQCVINSKGIEGGRGMTWKEHKPNGVALGLLSTPVIYNTLATDEINYVLCLGLSVFFAGYGAIFPDFDIPPAEGKSREPLINRFFRYLFKLLGFKHRSWQTHSVLISPIPWVILLILARRGITTTTNSILLTWISIGMLIGLFSHLLLDSMTSKGIHIIPNKKFYLFGKGKGFVTGETITNGKDFFGRPKVQKNIPTFVIRKINWALVVVGLAYNILYILKLYNIL